MTFRKFSASSIKPNAKKTPRNTKSNNFGSPYVRFIAILAIHAQDEVLLPDPPLRRPMSLPKWTSPATAANAFESFLDPLPESGPNRRLTAPV